MAYSSLAAIFFNSLKEIESDLPTKVTEAYEEIRKKFNDKKFQSFLLFPTSASISLLDDLNDALAEFQILKLQRTSIKKSTFRFFHRSERNTLQKINSLLSSIQVKFNNIESEGNGNSSTWTRTNFWTRQSTVGDEGDECNDLLFGEQKQKIVDCLCSEGFKAIGIYGMCGSGKTTLVDKILKSQTVGNMFYPIIRICLSDISPKEQLDTKIVRHLLEVLGYDVDEFTGKYRDVDPEHELKQRLMPRKFLIVLDDVWFCNDWFIIKPDEADGNGDRDRFTHALPKDTGGAVIVTSRIKHVAQKIVGNEYLFHLEPRKENDHFLEAVVRKKVGDKNKVEELVRRLHGLPLAAKTLASDKYHG